MHRSRVALPVAAARCSVHRAGVCQPRQSRRAGTREQTPFQVLARLLLRCDNDCSWLGSCRNPVDLMRDSCDGAAPAPQWSARLGSMSRVRRLLARYEPGLHPEAERLRQASVAAILRQRDHGVELLFIRRAEHPKDPWSGHMGFPGGRMDPADKDALEVAVREAREEVALDLVGNGERIGRLSDLEAVAGGRPIEMVISVFVFELLADTQMSLNHEVQEVVWVPLAFLMDRRNRSTFSWSRFGLPVPLPCYRYRERMIWGLTLRMVDELLELLASPE